MKSPEEISKLADDYCVGFAKEYHNELSTGFYAGYTQCQDDNKDKVFTEADMLKAIEMARETESVRRGALSEDWDDVEKYTEEEIINK